MQRPGSLSCGTSVGLSMHPSLKPLRSRQKAQPSSPSPPPFPRAYFSDFLRWMEMDKEMQAPGSAVRAGVSASGLFTLCPPTTTAKGHHGAVGPDSSGMRGSPEAGLGYQSWKRGACPPAL